MSKPPFDDSLLRTILMRTNTLGLAVDVVFDMSHLLWFIEARLAGRRRFLVTFVNPSSHALDKTHPQYRSNLAAFDAVLPDGFGMSMAVRWLHGFAAKRISFDTTSLAPRVMRAAERSAYSVILVGGAPGRAEAAAARLAEVFPRLRVAGTMSGYGDINVKAAEIAALDPDIVICGMGAGAQEDLLIALSKTSWVGCGFTCGGYFDQLAEGFTYYPAWVDQFDLRWAYRLVREPRRLWRRYLLTYPAFVAALFRAVMQQRLRRRSGVNDLDYPGGLTNLPVMDMAVESAAPVSAAE